jgi:PAS domain S-box-containing protein
MNATHVVPAFVEPHAARAEMVAIRERLAGVADPVAVLEGVFALSPFGLQVFRADGQCLLVNRAFRRLFGWDPPADYNVLSDEGAVRSGALAFVQRAFAGEVAEVPASWYELRDRRQGGAVEARRVAVRATCFPLRGSDGAVSHVVSMFEDATRETLALEALERERENYRLLSNAAPQIVWTASAPLSADYVNRRWVEYTGQSSEAAAGRGWRVMVHPDDQLAIDRAWWSAEESGRPFEVELRLRAADGTYRWFVDAATPLFDEQGIIVRWVGTCIDVEEQKRAEDRQRFLRQASKTLAESLDFRLTLERIAKLAVPAFADYCAVHLAVQDGSIESVAVAHADPEKARNLRDMDLRAPWSRSAQSGPGAVIRTGKSELVREALEPPVSADQGVLRGVMGTRSHICVPLSVRGESIGAMTFVLAESARRFSPRDLPLAEELAQRAAVAIDQARAFEREHQIRRQAQAVLVRLSRLQRFTSALAEAVTQNEVARVAVEEGGHCIQSATTALYVLRPDGSLELLRHRGGPDLGLGRACTIAPGARLPAMLAIETRQPLWIESSAEFAERWPELAERSGGPKPEAFAVVPLVLESRPAGVLAFGYRSAHTFHEDERAFVLVLAHHCAQAFERARLLEDANDAARRAHEACRAKDDFLSIVSHELRTPLNAIHGWAHLLSGDNERDARLLARGLDAIRRNSKAQIKIIEDILDVSRIITGKLRVSLHPLELEPLVLAAVETVRPTALAKGVHLDCFVKQSVTVLGDAERLQQVVWNLLSNAVKFTPKGGRVVVRLERTAREARIIVEDTGIGISAEHLPFVFDRFRQVDSSTSRGTGGLGLGLAIVRHLVEAHGGRARAESPGLGCGCTLVVELPMEGTLRDDAAKSRDTPILDAGVASERATLPSGGLIGLRVLVVDDENDAAELVARVMIEHGASVEIALSVSAALAKMSSFRPNVVVSDIGMPMEDGYTLIRKLREAAPSAPPALALTAYVRPEDAQRAIDAGYQAHLPKPIDPLKLVVAVALLGQRAQGARC